jgi:hypothetical protein
MHTESLQEPKMMRPQRFADSRDLNRRTFYAYLANGVFPSYKIAGVVLVDPKECDAIIRGGRQRVDAGLAKSRKAKTGKAS